MFKKFSIQKHNFVSCVTWQQHHGPHAMFIRDSAVLGHRGRVEGGEALCFADV